MKRILLTVLVAAMFTGNAYAAVPDDDSAIYYPYPAQPQPQQETPAAPAPAKKPATKKATPAKKPAPKKPAPKKAATTKKTATVKQSSLQKGIELMNLDRYEQAKPYLLKAIQEERNNPNAWYWYGVYHEKTGGFYQAQYFYTKAITIDPAFEPLSRVVFYPNDNEKTPLWDPKHPARVYPVETANVPMNVSRFPNAPNDPEVPQVPVYVPPEPNTSPLDGDSWNPAVYVPPSPEELAEFHGQSPVYTPPDAIGVVAEKRNIPVYGQEESSVSEQSAERDNVLRNDTPRYVPPAPKPQQTEPRKTVSTQTKPAQPKPSTTVPASRIVRQSTAKKTAAKTPAKTTTKKTAPKSQPSKTPARTPASRDVRPQTPSQPPRQQTQTQRQQTPSQTPRQQTQTPTPVPPPSRQSVPEPSQPQVRQNDYLPPVGQYAPDPGTISDRPIPPVGQSQN